MYTLEILAAAENLQNLRLALWQLQKPETPKALYLMQPRFRAVWGLGLGLAVCLDVDNTQTFQNPLIKEYTLKSY